MTKPCSFFGIFYFYFFLCSFQNPTFNSHWVEHFCCNEPLRSCRYNLDMPITNMSSSLASNPKVQLAATAVVSAAVAAGAILSYQRLQHGERLTRLKRSIPNPADDEPSVQNVVLTPLPPLPLNPHPSYPTANNLTLSPSSPCSYTVSAPSQNQTKKMSTTSSSPSAPKLATSTTSSSSSSSPGTASS